MAYADWEAWPISTDQQGNPIKGLVPEPLVIDLAPDPTNMPQLFVMQGLLGQGATPHTWRIYQNHALDDYFEVEEQYIHFALQLPAEGYRVWVIRDSPMKRVSRRFQPAEVDYLSGAISQQAARRAEFGAPIDSVGGPEPTQCPPCPSRSP